MSNYVHRAWGNSRVGEDVIDIYVTRYERDVSDGTADRAYGMFNPDEGITWHAFRPADVIRPYLSINGLLAAVALQTVDDDFIHYLVAMGRRVDGVVGDLTYEKP